MKSVTCCYKCEDRYPACHDSCEKYKKIKAENAEITHREVEGRRMDNAFIKMAMVRKEKRRRSGKI